MAKKTTPKEEPETEEVETDQPDILTDLATIYPEFYSAQITLVVGESGAGKTWYCWNHPDKDRGFYLDLEDRYKEMKKITDAHGSNICPEHWKNCKQYDAQFNTDKIATFKLVQKVQNQLLKENKYDLIVIDGASDLRRMAEDKWETENNKTAYGMQAWGEINTMTKDIIFRFMNWARVMDKKVIITAWIVPDYNSKSGKQKIDLKDFISAPVDEIITLKREGSHYFIRRAKSPLKANSFIEWDIGQAALSAPAEHIDQQDAEGDEL